MLSTVADLFAVTGSGWLGIAVLMLLAAAWIYRQQRLSAQKQGERLGQLERRADSERTRRQQIEAVLLDDGLRLPFWPPDGPDGPSARAAIARRREPDDDDQVEEYTTDLPIRRMAVPPLPESVSRHRR